MLMNLFFDRRGEVLIKNLFDQCHQKEVKEIHCRVDKSLIRDCICCEWEVPRGETQTVFQTAGFKEIFGSGFVSYECGSAPFIVVKFFVDSYQVGDMIKVFKDSCVAFTYTKFNSIKVTCPNEGHHHCDCGCNCMNDCEGEICITTRVPVC